MTNNQHGQVPEALIDLIDTYAETRYRYGGIYNAKTEAARNAVIEALSGVQALSAAPGVTSEQRRLIGVIADKIEDGTLFQSGIYQKKDFARFVRNMLDVTPTAPAASPTPPAEQQAQPGAVYAGLPERRRVFLCTKCGGRECESGLIHQPHPPCKCGYLGFAENLDFTEDQMRDFADRTHAARLRCKSEQARLATLWGYVRADAALKAAPGEPFQHRVQPWLLQCFGAEIAADTVERNHRFLEEALELVQSTGCTQSEAHQLVDYVFGRPVGEPAQEVGGVMVTLAALCLANGLDMHNAGEIELARIWTKVEAIRAKQAAKPKHSPLPQAAPQQEAQEPAFWMNEKGHTWSHSDWKQFPKHRAKYPIPLYPHFPAPQPAPDCHHRPPCDECAAIAAQGGK